MKTTAVYVWLEADRRLDHAREYRVPSARNETGASTHCEKDGLAVAAAEGTSTPGRRYAEQRSHERDSEECGESDADRPNGSRGIPCAGPYGSASRDGNGN